MSGELRLIIVSGLSGSGKSVALHVLEDLGYYCIDNLPAGLLIEAVEEVRRTSESSMHLAVGVDARNPADNLDVLPDLLRELQAQGIETDIVFLHASEETLLQRYRESQRRHPMAEQGMELRAAINSERAILAEIELSADLIIDTSRTSIYELAETVRSRVDRSESNALSVLVESFGFKYGIPSDADFVFDLHDALALIRGCNPRPGTAVSAPPSEYVIPDVFVRKVDKRWQVEISPTGVPRLSVNQTYAKLLRGSGEHAVLKSQLQEARWLIRSLEIRNETLLKVATSIVTRQTEFLEHGDEAMKPLVLRDIAEEIGMHESTISRVTTNKYMHTPRGVFEFKYFFSSHLSSDSGEDQSSTSVRAKIRKLVSTENPAKPLSDSKITNLLKEEGISVARRTVAKYREALNIPSSSERRIRETR